MVLGQRGSLPHKALAITRVEAPYLKGEIQAPSADTHSLTHKQDIPPPRNIYNLSEYRSILLNIQTSLRHVQYGKFYWV